MSTFEFDTIRDTWIDSVAKYAANTREAFARGIETQVQQLREAMSPSTGIQRQLIEAMLPRSRK